MGQAPALEFGHVGIYVRDIDKMADFYHSIMGFAITDRGSIGESRIVFLSRNIKDHHQIALVTGRPADLSFNVINQISFRVSSFSDLLEFYKKLKTLPEGTISDIDPISHGNALSIYFRDPEGNRLELFVDTPWYANQPMRLPFNPDLPEDEIWAWLAEQVKAMPGYKTREEWEEEASKLIQ